MRMLDANIILRYLLNDNEKMADEAEKIIREERAWVTTEVMAEVVYVLKGVYGVGCREIKTSLLSFLSEVETTEREIIELGLEIYAEKSLDFVDCLLYAYNQVKGYEIMTFDKKLKTLLRTV